jgi:urate oxidase
VAETASKQETSIVMGQNNYGKSDVRLVKVFRGSERHEIKDLRVDVAQEGDFDAAHTEGDNTDLMATDTMRNTVYALAKDKLAGSIEDFGIELVRHFLEAAPKAKRVRVRLVEHPWSRIEVDGRPHEHSFVRDAGSRTANIEGDETGFQVNAGLDDLLVLKTTNSGWEGYLREQYTTLPETSDRILATVVTADWSYSTTDVNFDEVWKGVKDRILATFTDHYSPSVQNTMYRMGEAVLERFPEVGKIHFSLPNKHHLLYDLSRFGPENNNEIFHASAEPYGLIEGTVERSS